jgi:cholesterol transport system auxiliary component
MYKFIFIVIAVVFMSGCSVTKPAITEYTINTKVKNIHNTKGGCLNRTIKVSQAFSSTALMSSKMSYVQGEYKQFLYSQSAWANSPNRAITTQIVKLLRETTLFKSVQTFKSRSKSSLILESNIEDFMQYFINNSTDSYARVVISFTLLDSQTSDIVATRTFSAKVNSQTLDANGGVQALNLALENVLKQTSGWLSEVCK